MLIDRNLRQARRMLAAGAALAILSVATTPPAEADWLGSTATWFQERVDDGADFLGSLVGGTASFGLAVAKAGCNAGPYDGRDLTGILAISFLYADSAMDAYLKGLSHAEKAVGIREQQGRVVFERISDLVVRPNYGNSFRNFSEVDHTSDRNEVLVAQLKQQAAAGFSDAAEKDLTHAIASLYTANELQAQAVVGLLLVAGYVKIAHDRGEGRAIVSLLSRELSRNGADSSVKTLVESPEAMLKLIGNFGEAFSLTNSVEQAVDFDVEEDELRRLGVEEDLAAVSAVAERRARAAAKPEAQAIAFQPGVETIRVMLNSTDLVDDRVSGIAVKLLGFACGGVFGQPSAAATPRPDTKIEQQPIFGRKEIIEAQQHLIDLGFLEGRADGAWGPKSRGVMQGFTRAHGLANTSGEPSFALLEELRLANSVSRQQLGSDPASIAQTTPKSATDDIPSASEIANEIGKDATEALDVIGGHVSNAFGRLLGGGSDN